MQPMTEIEKSWHTLRIDIAVARTYDEAIAARNQLVQSGRLMWLEQLLPTLLFIRTMEIHDDAVVDTLARRGEVLDPKKDRPSLKGRLLHCQRHWVGFNPRLVTHADRRNDYGHKISDHASWKDLERCVDDVQESLLSMLAVREPIDAVSVDYERVPGTGSFVITWDANIRVSMPTGEYRQTWRTTETIELESVRKAAKNVGTES